MRCPTCDKEFSAEDAPTTLPFCSKRCHQIDLGRWLSEKQSIAVEKPRHSMPDEEGNGEGEEG
jgi:uncharacterized protein